MTINLYLDCPNKPGDRPIMLVYQDGKLKIKVSTAEKIEKKFWDTEKQKINRRHLQNLSINGFLSDLKMDVEIAVREAKRNNKAVDKDLLLIAMKKMKPPSQDFEGYFERFLIEKKKTCSLNTIKEFQNVYNSLSAFFKTKKISLSLVNLNLTRFKDWITYMSEVEKNANMTVNKKIKGLQVFLKYAAENKVFDFSIFEKFKVNKLESSQRITLSESELMSLYQFELTENYLQRARDIFCFACFTGLRYSDLANFEPEQILESLNNSSLKIVCKKTKREFIVPFNKFALEILKKYDNNLPKMSNQKLNDYIKIVGQKAGIDKQIISVKFVGKERIETKNAKYELISCHIARRTFITVSAVKGVPIPLIQKAVGHSSFAQTLKYFNAEIETLTEAINKAWN